MYQNHELGKNLHKFRKVRAGHLSLLDAIKMGLQSQEILLLQNLILIDPMRLAARHLVHVSR